MRSFVLLILFVSVTSTFAQKNTVNLNLGLNRIGLSWEASYSRLVEQHEFTAGVKWYAQNQVFERQYPGFVLGYNYQFREIEKRWNAGVGLKQGFYGENKSSGFLTVTNQLFHVNVDWRLAKRFRLRMQPELGWVNNWVFGAMENVQGYYYLNYGFTVGLTYYWGHSDQ